MIYFIDYYNRSHHHHHHHHSNPSLGPAVRDVRAVDQQLLCIIGYCINSSVIGYCSNSSSIGYSSI